MTASAAPTAISSKAVPQDHGGFHAIQRRLASLLPDANTPVAGGSLELTGIFGQERPRLNPPEPLEDKRLLAHRVEGDPVPRFAAFLDGVQSSRVAQYLGGIPLVHATVAAVIRVRRERRMSTWRSPLVRRRLYAPLALMPPAARRALEESELDVCDSTAASGKEVDSLHPFAMQDAAYQAVQRDRSKLELQLAEDWCESMEEDLFVDGGISESVRVAKASCVVGVVKSHQELRVHGDDLGTVLRLEPGERSSAMRVAARQRTPVASWYLRLRDQSDHDPLWGLVRVEVADLTDERPAAIRARANEVSRWVLAEALPLSLPDGRWDKLVYGIHDCEAFLRAIQ